MKVGDKVKTKTYGATLFEEQTIYTVLEIGEDFVKLKHPEIGGYFSVKPESIIEVINESG